MCSPIFLVEGIKTTIPFQQAILDNSDFKSGKYNIGWVEQFLNKMQKDLQKDLKKP